MNRLTRLPHVLAVMALAALAVAAAPTSAPPPASGADAYRFLEEFASFGNHRTGTSVDHETAGWFADHLRDAGYDVEVQPFDFPRFVPAAASIRIGEAAPPVMPLYYSGVTPSDGVRGELVDVGLGTPVETGLHEMAGKVVLAHVPMPAPGLIPTLEVVRTAAQDAGAVALIAAVDAPANQLFGINVTAQHGVCGLPVLVVGSQDGALLSSLSGQAAEVVLDASVQPGESQNVVAVREGPGPGVVIIGTPLNGWFRTATERGSGAGTLLTLARHFATVDTTSTLVFVGTGGHEVGFLGLGEFIEANPDLVQRATAYVHLGASVAAKHQIDLGDTIVSTGLVDPLRVLITSENPALLSVAGASFALAAPFAALPPASGQSGEQQVMYEAGVPILSLSGTFLWFHTPRDLPDTTSPDLLHPMVDAFRTAVTAIDGIDPALVRDTNLLADTLAPLTASGSGEAVEGC